MHDNSTAGTACSTLAPLAAAVVILAVILAPVPPLAAAPAQTSPLDTRLVRVNLGPALPLDSLLAGGFDIVSLKQDAWADLYVHPGDEERLQALGAVVQVQIGRAHV